MGLRFTPEDWFQQQKKTNLSSQLESLKLQEETIKVNFRQRHIYPEVAY